MFGDGVGVVTICSSAHLDVWRLTTQLLPKYVQADNYRLFVPREEIPLFQGVSASCFEILSQDELGLSYRPRLEAACESAGNAGRFGWYLQQFYKIEALLQSRYDRCVIWDADCVPLAPFRLFSKEGKPRYMMAGEHHRPYFEVIEKLLGMTRVQDFSFVVPGFPIPRIWLEQLVVFIQERTNSADWWDALIDVIDFGLLSGFSETETLGTWVANQHPTDFEVFPVNWERRGHSSFGHAREHSPDSLQVLAKGSGLEIITFENWDIPTRKSFIRKVVRAMRELPSNPTLTRRRR